MPSSVPWANQVSDETVRSNHALKLNGMSPLVAAVAGPLKLPARSAHKNSRAIEKANALVQVGSRLFYLGGIQRCPLSQKINTPLREKRVPPAHQYL